MSSSRDDGVRLRDAEEGDLEAFFEQQQDPVANVMAAFPARDRETFMNHWRKNVLGDPSAVKKTVLCDGEVAGHVLCFERGGKRLVGYWLAQPFWGRGIATRALAALLDQVDTRPLHAHVAKHNTGSIRVLEKCGFRVSGEGYVAMDDGESVEEYLYTLAHRRDR